MHKFDISRGKWYFKWASYYKFSAEM